VWCCFPERQSAISIQDSHVIKHFNQVMLENCHIWSCVVRSAEDDNVQGVDSNVFIKETSETSFQLVDDSVYSKSVNCNDVEQPAQLDVDEDGIPDCDAAPPDVSGEADVEGAESGQADALGNEVTTLRSGTSQSLHGEPVVELDKGETGSEVGVTPPDEGAEVKAEPDSGSGPTPTSNLSGQGQVPFEDDFDDGGGDQMLLERDGKFRVVNVDDVMAENEVRSRSSSSSSEAALRISSLSVKTGSGSTRSRTSSHRSAAQPPMPRSKSAFTVPESRRRSMDYNSTHRLTEDQKRQLERQQARRAEKALMDEQQQREREEKKRQECDDAFDAWLRRKRIDAAQRRRERIQEMREERVKNNKNKVWQTTPS